MAPRSHWEEDDTDETLPALALEVADALALELEWKMPEDGVRGVATLPDVEAGPEADEEPAIV